MLVLVAVVLLRVLMVQMQTVKMVVMALTQVLQVLLLSLVQEVTEDMVVAEAEVEEMLIPTSLVIKAGVLSPCGKQVVQVVQQEQVQRVLMALKVAS